MLFPLAKFCECCSTNQGCSGARSPWDLHLPNLLAKVAPRARRANPSPSPVCRDRPRFLETTSAYQEKSPGYCDQPQTPCEEAQMIQHRMKTAKRSAL